MKGEEVPHQAAWTSHTKEQNETVTGPLMNEENRMVEDGGGYLADDEKRDDDDPLIQSVSTYCFVYKSQSIWQSVKS